MEHDLTIFQAALLPTDGPEILGDQGIESLKRAESGKVLHSVETGKHKALAMILIGRFGRLSLLRRDTCTDELLYLRLDNGLSGKKMPMDVDGNGNSMSEEGIVGGLQAKSQQDKPAVKRLEGHNAMTTSSHQAFMTA